MDNIDLIKIVYYVSDENKKTIKEIEKMLSSININSNTKKKI